MSQQWPNVLFLLVDDMDYGDCSVFNGLLRCDAVQQRHDDEDDGVDIQDRHDPPDGGLVGGLVGDWVGW